MTTYVSRYIAVLAAATSALFAVAAPASAGTRSATPTNTGYYLALGDSLAYGYQPVQPLDRAEGYVQQLHAALAAREAKLRLQNLGCPRETTTSFLAGGVCPYPEAASQLAIAERFLRAHKHNVRLVTLDLGGNDLNRCVNGNLIDEACVLRALPTVAANIGEILARLRAAAPRTPIVAMTYYDAYLAAWLSGPEGQLLASRSLQLTDALNTILSTAYRAAGVRVADVAGAFSSHDWSLTNGVPVNVQKICALTWACAPPPLGPDIHPNKAGYTVIAAAFLAQIPAHPRVVRRVVRR